MSQLKDMTVEEAQECVERFLVEQGNAWTRIDNRFYLFTHMSEEMGELARHIITAEFNLSLDRTCKEAMPKERALSLIEDDLGDLLYHLLKLAVAYNINLEGAFMKTIANIKQRYGKKQT